MVRKSFTNKQTNKQTDRQTNRGENNTSSTSLSEVNILRYILKLYTHEGCNALLDIYNEPTHNITSFYIHILSGENDTLFNFLNFEDTYNIFFYNFMNIFQQNIPLIDTGNPDVALTVIHSFICDLFVKASDNTRHISKNIKFG